MRIGIYSGTFNPVHAGHIGFALQAISAGRLDAVYFLPERRPRRKSGVEHYAHRVAMLQKACRPHPQLDVLELPDTQFSIAKTWPRLRQRWPQADIYMLMGSDVALHVPEWPGAKAFLPAVTVVVGRRTGSDTPSISSRQLTIDSYAPQVSATLIRQALRSQKTNAPGMLQSVRRYAIQHWLYTPDIMKSKSQ